MIKRFLIAWLVVFVVWFIGSQLVHGGLLHEDYGALPNLFRTEEEMMKRFPIMVLAYILLAGAFVWIYSRGISEKPWLGQGLRFGVAVAFLGNITTYMIFYVVQPMPGSMVIKQIVFDSLLTVLLGVLVAFVYRRKHSQAIALDR